MTSACERDSEKPEIEGRRDYSLVPDDDLRNFLELFEKNLAGMSTVLRSQFKDFDYGNLPDVTPIPRLRIVTARIRLDNNNIVKPIPTKIKNLIGYDLEGARAEAAATYHYVTTVPPNEKPDWQKFVQTLQQNLGNDPLKQQIRHNPKRH